GWGGRGVLRRQRWGGGRRGGGARAAGRGRSARGGVRRSRPCRNSQPAGQHLSSGQVLDGEQALEDPVVEAGLAELVAVEDRLDALPPFLEKFDEGRVRGSVIEAVEGVKNPGGPVDTETALARSHPKPDRPADVVEAGRAAPSDRRRQLLARDQLALADDLLRSGNRLLGANSRAQPVKAVVLGARKRLLGGRARALDPELLAGGVDHMLGHPTIGGRLASGGRGGAGHTV